MRPAGLILSAGWVSAMDGIAISTHYTWDKADSVHFPRFGNGSNKEESP
jgi:hypothetical protein